MFVCFLRQTPKCQSFLSIFVTLDNLDKESSPSWASALQSEHMLCACTYNHITHAQLDVLLEHKQHLEFGKSDHFWLFILIFTYAIIV